MSGTRWGAAHCDGGRRRVKFDASNRDVSSRSGFRCWFRFGLRFGRGVALGRAGFGGPPSELRRGIFRIFLVYDLARREAGRRGFGRSCARRRGRRYQWNSLGVIAIRDGAAGPLHLSERRRRGVRGDILALRHF